MPESAYIFAAVGLFVCIQGYPWVGLPMIGSMIVLFVIIDVTKWTMPFWAYLRQRREYKRYLLEERRKWLAATEVQMRLEHEQKMKEQELHLAVQNANYTHSRVEQQKVDLAREKAELEQQRYREQNPPKRTVQQKIDDLRHAFKAASDLIEDMWKAAKIDDATRKAMLFDQFTDFQAQMETLVEED